MARLTLPPQLPLTLQRLRVAADAMLIPVLEAASHKAATWPLVYCGKRV
jgi:hypothetical protein